MDNLKLSRIGNEAIRMNSGSYVGYGYNVAIEKLAEELAVPQDRFDQAERRYKDLGEFLHRDAS